MTRSTCGTYWARVEVYTPDSREKFLVDTMVQDAIIRNLEIIGEAVRNLSTEPAPALSGRSLAKHHRSPQCPHPRILRGRPGNRLAPHKAATTRTQAPCSKLSWRSSLRTRRAVAGGHFDRRYAVSCSVESTYCVSPSRRRRSRSASPIPPKRVAIIAVTTITLPDSFRPYGPRACLVCMPSFPCVTPRA